MNKSKVRISMSKVWITKSKVRRIKARLDE